jgi:hypothetical protein
MTRTDAEIWQDWHAEARFLMNAARRLYAAIDERTDIDGDTLRSIERSVRELNRLEAEIDAKDKAEEGT